MQTASSNKGFYLSIAMLSVLAAIACEPALAAGGLEKVNTFMENILSVLRGVQVVTVTVAIIWIGYKLLFSQAGIRDCFPIIGGALLIGGGAELAKFLLE